jgi:hypothetical protein
MGHEVSATVQVDEDNPKSKWVNIATVGPSKGVRLTPLFSFERHEYDTEAEASHAAERRSEEFRKEVDRSMERHRKAPKGYR